ncbi:carbohydrate ABC transporter permease [Pseudactinotalea suaedae]|uniref:carbohydrate ABC transporter permease n=1 Tax=Pseudactinotalea suaedae TaxID=1524924 RepID=UPI0019D65DEB|nr:carbohydrate ABC transporter permease [Pseudactinotalea suaedae]
MSAVTVAEKKGEPTQAPAAAGRRTRPTKVRESLVDRLFLVGVYALLITFLLVVLLPLLYIVASSFSSPAAVSAGRVFLWPVEFTLRGYEVALSSPKIVRGFTNSLFYTAAGTLISVTLTVMLAYPLSRADFVGRKVLTGAVVFTMLFAGGMIPTYLVVQAMGMLDTRWALLIPNAVAVWPAILAITYFRTAIPDEVREAGELDGASDLRILWTLVLPLATPMIAVIALMYAIVQWNSYFDALIYLRDESLYPLQLVLRNILILNTDGGGDATSALERQQLANLLKYSLIVISTVPVMLIYPFVARYFTKGLLLGAVKG